MSGKKVVARDLHGRRQSRRAAPTTPPAFLREDKKAFLKDNSLDVSANTYMLWACCSYYYKTAKMPLVYAAPDLLALKPDDFPDKLDADGMAYLQLASIDPLMWSEFVFDLVACFKSKALKQSNVDSYFASIKSPYKASAKVLSMLEWTAYATPGIDVEGLRKDMETFNPFIDYHTRAFSSASLILKFAETNGEIITTLFPNVKMEELKDVDDHAYDISQSKRLPRLLLGVVYIWNDVNRIEINRWYQGEKAADQMDIRERRLWTAFFKKQISFEQVNFDAAKDLTELLKAAEDAHMRREIIKVAESESKEEQS